MNGREDCPIQKSEDLSTCKDAKIHEVKEVEEDGDAVTDIRS